MPAGAGLAILSRCVIMADRRVQLKSVEVVLDGEIVCVRVCWPVL